MASNPIVKQSLETPEDPRPCDTALISPDKCLPMPLVSHQFDEISPIGKVILRTSRFLRFLCLFLLVANFYMLLRNETFAS